MTPKQIAHLDLDCFYVSVERIEDPSLVGKPVIVGGTPTGRGVVASASYEARKFGVHSAMPTAKALRLCPQLIVVSSHFDEYGAYSDNLHKRLQEIAPVVERASIDEMYLDFAGCESIYGNDLPGFMKTLQRLVWDEFKLPCTIALASNKTLAKIATDTVKPGGLCFVPHGREKEFLAPLPIDAIPGVGKRTAEVLRKHGFQKVVDLQEAQQNALIELLGKHGIWIHSVANGYSSDTVSPEHTRKSISREETFAHDISDKHQLEQELHRLVEDVCSSLRSHRWRARTVTLKLRYADFKTITHAASIEPAEDDALVFTVAKNLFHEAYNGKKAVRLLGVRLSNFVDDAQLELSLFDVNQRRHQMFDAVDQLRKKYGDEVIHIGGV